MTGTLILIGTDATIAEHIAKIIDREYVEARQDRGAKFLVPSDLGIGLVDGYNQIGFDRSLTKPHLRREVSSILMSVVFSNYLLTIPSPFYRRSIECK